MELIQVRCWSQNLTPFSTVFSPTGQGSLHNLYLEKTCQDSRSHIHHTVCPLGCFKFIILTTGSLPLMSVDGLAHQKWHNQWRTMQEIMGEILKKTWDFCRSNGQYPKEFNLKLKIDYFKDLTFGTIWDTAMRKEALIFKHIMGSLLQVDTATLHHSWHLSMSRDACTFTYAFMID